MQHIPKTVDEFVDRIRFAFRRRMKLDDEMLRFIVIYIKRLKAYDELPMIVSILHEVFGTDSITALDNLIPEA